MEPMLEGLKVVELAEWAFVPSAGAVLADWGADVVKIEHPTRGDALRGLKLPGGADDFHHMMEQMNRGKRSIGLDVAHPDGRQVLLELVAGADVFVTSLTGECVRIYPMAVWLDIEQSLGPVLDQLEVSVALGHVRIRQRVGENLVLVVRFVLLQRHDLRKRRHDKR